MTTISWPEKLRGPLVAGYSREEAVGFRESPVAAGPSFVEPFTDDAPTFHNVTYQFKEGDARRFQLWLKQNKFRFLSPWFNGPIINEERRESTVECRFTADGYPQLQGKTIGGIYTYAARLLTRNVQSTDLDYATEVDAMWATNCGDIDLGSSLLDEGLNG